MKYYTQGCAESRDLHKVVFFPSNRKRKMSKS